MCIAIVKPAKLDISDERLENCFFNNPDGAGFAYYNSDGRLVIRKGFFKFSRFLREYKKVCENQRMVIHFRIKTVGDKNEKNCHPFPIGMNSCLIHNGTVSGVKTEDGLSDSGTISKWMKSLSSRHPGSCTDTAFLSVLEQLIKPSRVAIMTPTRFILLNKDAWKEDDGVFYSNETFKAKKPVYSFSSAGHQHTYNQSPPFDFSPKNSQLPRDHFQGMNTLGNSKPIVSVYSFATTMNPELRNLLEAIGDISGRRFGSVIVWKCQDLYPQRSLTSMSMEEIGKIRKILITWLEWDRKFNPEETQRLSTGDLVAIVGQLGFTVCECLTQLLAASIPLEAQTESKKEEQKAAETT